MSLRRLITAVAVAGICILGSMTIANATNPVDTLLVDPGDNGGAQTAGTLGLTATVTPSAILFLNTGGFEVQSGTDPNYTLGLGSGATAISAAVPLSESGGAFQGDGVNDEIGGNAGRDTFTPIYVSLFLSTAQSSVTLSVSDSGLTNGTFTFSNADLKWAFGSASADNAGGTGTWTTASTDSGTAAVALTATTSGLFNGIQTYSLTVPYGTPAGTYTDTVTYTISDF